MKIYEINQFIILQEDEFAIIQNNSGINILKSKKLIKLFEYFDNNNVTQFLISEIRGYFDSEEEVKDNILFMIETNLIKLKVKPFGKISELNIFVNDPIIYRSLEFNLVGAPIPYIVSSNLNLDINNSTNDLVNIVILNPFNYNQFCELVDKMKKKDLCLIVVFSYNSKFYISNLYKHSWFNPCPKCFFLHLISSIRGWGKINHKITYQTVLDLIYTKNIDLEPQIITNNYNIQLLISEILKIPDLDYNILSNRIVSIDYEVNYDQATHWELCDCYE